MEHRFPEMGWKEWAYNPYGIKGFRNAVRPYVRSGFKVAGLNINEDRAMDYASEFNKRKADFFEDVYNRVTKRRKPVPAKREPPPPADDDPEKPARGPSSFSKFSNDMSFSYKLRRGRRPPKKDPFARLGVVTHSETRGRSTAIVQSGEAAGAQHGARVDFGHYSYPIYNGLINVFICFLRMLCAKTGSTIVNYNRTTSSHLSCNTTPTHRVALAYRRHPNDIVVYAFLELNNLTDTIVQTANKWYAVLQNQIKDTPNDNAEASMKFIYIDYYQISGSLSLARIDISDALLHMQGFSTMRMQNRTTGNDANASSMEDITNNPVMFRALDVRGSAVQHRVWSDPSVAGESLGGSSDGYTGFIKKWARTLNAFSDHTNPRDVMHVLGTGRKLVRPGHYYTSVLKFKRSMSIDAYFNMHWAWIFKQSSAQSDARIPMGTSRVFEVDKYMHTMQGTSLVDIGIQLNVTLKTLIKLRRPSIPRIHYNRGALSDANDQIPNTSS